MAQGVATTVEDVRVALVETWREVDSRRERGEERWGGGGGEAAFWRRFVGRIYERVGGGPTLPDALLGRLVSHFGNEHYWRLYPEVEEVLSALRSRGIKLVVVSNWDSSLPGLLERLGVTRFLDGLVVSASFGASKPARSIFDEAVRLAGVPHAEVLHVGDSIHDDYEGARAAGLSSLLLDRHGRAPDGVEAISSLAEIPPRVLPR